MYETISIYCPNCAQKQPSISWEEQEKNGKSKALFLCVQCRCSILVNKDATGDFKLSVKQYGHYKN